ncbi:extracellular solute-binding protein [Desulfobacterales bacterium HSG2]|nr:extracellular solute-binding protein [Desulfobacterales bacterium HSG2]
MDKDNVLQKPLNRRDFLKKSASTVAGAMVSVNAPFVHAKGKVMLRVLGTHVTLQEVLRKRAEKELGIRLVFEPRGEAEILERGRNNPGSFDLYEHWSDAIRVLWKAKSIQPISTKKLRYWDQVNNLTKTGKITPDAKIGMGDAPVRITHVRADGSLGSRETGNISFMPYVHNVDSFGYNTKVIPRGEAYKTESWGWLLDEKYKGKVMLVNAPTIGVFDAALAARAKGLITFRDMGNMSREEIDKLFAILIRKKKEGHFSGFWSSVPESAELFKNGEAVIGSMFSPAVATLNGQGMSVVYAAPKEGYRAWHGIMCLSAMTKGRTLDAAYEYMNWWLSGWPGAFISRQGYYISNPSNSKEYMSEAEWDYWYAGKPAAEDLRGTDGNISVRSGDIRNGGSYEKRLSNVYVWNTVMSEYDYTVQRWNEFLFA